MTLGLYCIGEGKSDSEVVALRRNAIDLLDRAEESYTMRRGYQDWIVDLYYLYDDFNDRRLHYNRAIEMASSDLIALMLKRLRKDARAALPSVPPSRETAG